jgi:hypothetical protein
MPHVDPGLPLVWGDSSSRGLLSSWEVGFTQTTWIIIMSTSWYIFKNKMFIRGQNSEGRLSGGGSISPTLAQHGRKKVGNTFDPRAEAQ